jgi:phenylalanyl-tRNA synthetase beta chain
VELAQIAARAARVTLEVRPAEMAPWHPGRCAELRLAGAVVGHAGELHPGVVAAFGLPERSCAVELVLDALPVPAPAPAPVISGYPPVLLDVALVVPAGVLAADVAGTLQVAAGPLLESVRLFDLYADEQRLGPDRRSLAFALRFRAPDRTLTLEEATAARDAAIAAVARDHGAELRG